MADVTIIRPATVDEKKDFIEVTGKKGEIDKIYSMIAEKQQEHVKTHTPFCSRCAKIDCEDAISKVKIETARLNTPDGEKIAKKIKLPDLDDYAKTSRFELLETTKVMESEMSYGRKVQTHTGYWENFRCKERGCGISVFVPKEEYESRGTKKIKKIEE